MRNLAGHNFPHRCSLAELREVCNQCCNAISALPGLKLARGLGREERDDLVASRLISPEFAYHEPSRAVALNESKSISIMVNEEDHLRVQSIWPGWSLEGSALQASTVEHSLVTLAFAHSGTFGYLSSSPFNCGSGIRHSAMFHLIALASSGRLPSVLRALGVMNVVSRGLFGESSKAIGAYVQISVGRDDVASLRAAGEVVMAEERNARMTIGVEQLQSKAKQAVEFAISSRSISLADSVRVLGWIRWASTQQLQGYPTSPREIDRILSLFEVRSQIDQLDDGKKRAIRLRSEIEALIKLI